MKSKRIHYGDHAFDFRRDERTDTWAIWTRRDDGKGRQIARLHNRPAPRIEMVALGFDKKLVANAVEASAVFHNWKGEPRPKETTNDDPTLPF